MVNTLLGTKTSLPTTLLKIIFLFQRWDFFRLVPLRVYLGLGQPLPAPVANEGLGRDPPTRNIIILVVTIASSPKVYQ